MKADLRSIYEQGDRSRQEDYLSPLLPDGISEHKFYILCDGIGGLSKGNIASKLVCEKMTEYFYKYVSGRDINKSDFNDALTHANYALNKDYDEEKMGTTLAFLSLSTKGAMVAHIGDSRIYHIRPNAPTPILYKSRDHTLAYDLLKIGQITQEELETNINRHQLTRYITSHHDKPSKADIHEINDVRTGDYFFICSDGMLENLSDDELVHLLSQNISDDEKKQLLIENSRENKDNHSAFVIRIQETEQTDKDNEFPATCRSDDMEYFMKKHGARSIRLTTLLWWIFGFILLLGLAIWLI